MSRSEAEALKNKGNAFFKSNQYQKAIIEYRQAIVKDASYHVPYSNASQAYFKLGEGANGQKAQEHFKEAADLGQQCINTNKEFLKGYHRAANALMQIKPIDYQKVMKVLKMAYAQPNSQSNNDLQKIDEVARPEAEKAEKKARKLLRKCEKTKLLGSDALHKADYTMAEKLYRKALEQCRRPEDDDIYVACLANLAVCHGAEYKYDDIIVDTTEGLQITLQDATKTHNVHFKCYFRRAMAFEALEKYRLALDDIMKCITIHPTHPACNKAKNRLKKTIKQDKKAKAKDKSGK